MIYKISIKNKIINLVYIYIRDNKYCVANKIWQTNFFCCLNNQKNLILVPIERFSVVLRHANLLFLKF